ncbi:hypothetical protein RD792_005118 [Penstemon davidsonii]|uniref:Cation/H+ exchanger domain-containing protein n=1 Tax=Penstemon davidsonii TaxID=160366 RepID=A0ABR0DJS4_9LAMI|nr:hypothetical protein RD792_005118 [Penstemon davidsonii]
MQILGGILFGPSILGHPAIMGDILFPPRSVLTLETSAAFGIMFFLFAVGVRTNPTSMVRPGKQAAILGMSTMVTTLLLSLSLSFILKFYVPMEDTLAVSLPYLAASQSLIAFPNISCLLAELKMSSTDIGRLAVSSAMFCDLIGISLVAILLGILQSNRHPTKSALSVTSAVLLVLIMVYIVKPLLLKVVKRIPPGKPVGDHYVFFCFTGNLVAGFISEVIGQHFVLGPLIFGLMVPDGPPLGAALISKLDYFVGKFLYPTFLTTSGLKTNFFAIEPRSLWIVMFLIVSSFLIKIAAVVLTSRFFDINFQDSIVIGLMLNARGVCELVVFNLWRDGGVLSDQEFALCVISVVGITAIITPLIKWLYDPSTRHGPIKRRTIQHSKRDNEFRILLCIQNQDNVPSMINLLEASNATEQSHIAVIAVLLVELAGRANPMLVAHHSTRALQTSNSKSSHIINALRQYELCNESCATVQSFSAISQLQTMHDDICRLASDQNATIIILPFHKHWEIDGSIGSVSRGTQNMNIKVMDKAPCSVGILVDRGILTGSLSILNNQSMYHVVVINIGGPDDAEALSYGARMGRHRNVTLTLIRFLLIRCDNPRERKQDNNLIDEVRQANLGNQNFIFQEQVVKDGVGLATSLRGLESNFDLIIVGRHHQASGILMGLGAWSECPELGVIGDILASPDFGSTASVLVVQQQRLRGEKFNKRMMKPVVISHEPEHDVSDVVAVPVDNDHDYRWEIAIDREKV